MDIAVTPVLSLTFSDQPWLASAKGTDTARTITLDPTKGFVSGTHYPDGYLKAGLPLGIVTATGLYGLYDDAATDGRGTAVGFLFSAVKVNAADATKKLGGALLWEGVIRTAKLPTPGIDANGKADLSSKFRFE